MVVCTLSINAISVNYDVIRCNFVNIACQRSFWSRVQLAKQLKRDNASHGEVTINNVATVSVHTNSFRSTIQYHV